VPATTSTTTTITTTTQPSNKGKPQDEEPDVLKEIEKELLALDDDESAKKPREKNE